MATRTRIRTGRVRLRGTKTTASASIAQSPKSLSSRKCTTRCPPQQLLRAPLRREPLRLGIFNHVHAHHLPIVGIELRDVATPAITADVGDVRDSIPEWETEDRRALT